MYILIRYDVEFEFSFPSELSPSLFTMADGQDHLLSPESLSFPSFSSAPSPITWNNFNLNNDTRDQPPHLQQGPPSPGAVADTGRQERPECDGKEEDRLFKAEEKNALDAFFSETLAKPPSIASIKRDSPDEEVQDPPSETQPVTAESGPVYQVKSRAKRARPNPGTTAGTSEVVEAETASSGPVKRTAHIASEQKRRTTIKENYKALVDLLLAGEETSGIHLSGGCAADDDLEETGNGKKKGKEKPKGRGRGRKGQDGAGATKSVVLERAADYLRWLERSNSELEREVTRLEGILAV